MKLAWATDVHLNFLERPAVQAWCAGIKAWEPGALLLGGDIGEATDLEEWLELLADELERPVHFVLGNHDYYKGGIEEVRARMRALDGRHPLLSWLPAHEVIELTPATGLIGHGGWGDARIGDYEGTPVRLNDHRLIEDLSGHDPAELKRRLQALGDEAAEHVRRVLSLALERHEHVILLTHVPPYREACWHEGKISDDDWAPHFTCKAVGDVILELMAGRPDRTLMVLCGHTHGAGEYWPLRNVVVKTGGAEYGAPATQPALLVR